VRSLADAQEWPASGVVDMPQAMVQWVAGMVEKGKEG
jgi:hypothetical protein